jgi:hypothetical protein
MTPKATGPIVVLMATLAVTACSTPCHAAGDPFLERHARGLAANTYHAFTIRFTSARRIYQAREPIAIELVYARPAELISEHLDGPDSLFYLRARFDRPVASPLEAMDSSLNDNVPGGVAGCQSFAPAVIQKTINNIYRFDRPGRYRVFYESKHVTRTFETSNVLEFEILPRDAAWESRVAEAARNTLASSRDQAARTQAFATLRVLATNEAATVVVPLFERGDDDVAEHGAATYTLFANSDRSFVVDALGRELTDSRRTFGWWFLRYLARLELARRGAAGPPFAYDEYADVMRRFAIVRARALKAVPGRLEDDLHRELMQPSDSLEFMPGISRAAREFPSETAAAFRRLSAEAQRQRLLDNWYQFAHPVFLAMVRAVYMSPAEESDSVRDIALRRLWQLAPDEGRSAMLSELRRERLRVSMQTVTLLPDRAFPALEWAWAAQLSDAAAEPERMSAAQRIERFGTARLAPTVRAFYQRSIESMSCGTRSALLAYLARVDARHVEDLLAMASTTERWDETCESSLIESVADMEWTTAVERVAVATLSHHDLGVVQNAARVLANYGSIDARRPLERALQVLEERRQQAISDGVEEDTQEMGTFTGAEIELARAIVGAKNWIVSPEEGRQMRGCAACAADLHFDESIDPEHSVTLFGRRRGLEHKLGFAVEHYYGCGSVGDLLTKLRQFPRGTRVYWHDQMYYGETTLDQWTRSDRDRLFAHVRTSAAAHGVVVQRRR